MACKQSVRIMGFVALILGLLSLQRSHDLHMTKQRHLADMERQHMAVKGVSLEEARYERKVKCYECLSGTFFMLSLI